MIKPQNKSKIYFQKNEENKIKVPKTIRRFSPVFRIFNRHKCWGQGGEGGEVLQCGPGWWGVPSASMAPPWGCLPIDRALPIFPRISGLSTRSSWSLLARSPLLLQNVVDVVHFAESLEERDEIQELRVRHVVEPGSYGYLRGSKAMQETQRCIRVYTSEQGTLWCWKSVVL